MYQNQFPLKHFTTSLPVKVHDVLRGQNHFSLCEYDFFKIQNPIYKEEIVLNNTKREEI